MPNEALQAKDEMFTMRLYNELVPTRCVNRLCYKISKVGLQPRVYVNFWLFDSYYLVDTCKALNNKW